MKNYMTKAYRCLLLLGTMFIVVACADYGFESDLDEKPIRLATGQAYNPTRAVTTNLQDVSFEGGERVNVYITGTSDTYPTATNIGMGGTSLTTCTTNAPENNINELIPDEQPYYLVGSNSTINLYACYPAEVKNITETFTVQDDQTDPENFKKSDLMLTGPLSHVKNNQRITLPFEHKMAKVIIKVIGDPDVKMDGTIIVGGIKKSIAIDVPNGDFKHPNTDLIPHNSDQDLVGDKGSITMLNGGAILIPPQEVTTSDEVGYFITASGHRTDDINNTGTAHFHIAAKRFEAGHVYKLTLLISTDNFTKSETISGWIADYDEMTLTPSGGLDGITIDPIDGDATVVTGDDTSEDHYYIYNGTERQPEPNVYYGTDVYSRKKLTLGEDYIFRYVDNKNAGTAQVLVIGQDFYSGLAKTRGFTIRRATAKINFAEGSDKTGVYFNLNEVIEAAEIENSGDGVVTYSAADAASAQVVAVDPVTGRLIKQNVGTATIKATATAGQNYDYYDPDNTDTYTVEIIPKPEAASDLQVTYETGNTIVSPDISDKAANQYFVYNGKAQTLTSLSIYDRVADNTLVNNNDYTYTLTDNTNAGNAKLKITGMGNYATVDITINVPIAKGIPTIDVVDTELTMGVQNNTAPMNRRKTRVATTQDWAAGNLQYSLSETSKVLENDIISITDKGVITGKQAGSTWVYVDVLGDATNWDPATQKKYLVTVVNSDFDFNLKKNASGNVVYNNATMTDGTVNNKRVAFAACHTTWVCPASGTWQLECWGAQGASTPTSWIANGGVEYAQGTTVIPTNRGMGGRGAHIAGRVYLKKGQVLHVVVGEEGRNILPGEKRNQTQVPSGKYELSGYAWNGGANLLWGGYQSNNLNTSDAAVYEVDYPISGGGGATDMSLYYGTYPGGKNMVGYNANTPVAELAWKSPQHLYSRVIVAGGGGGGLYYDSASDGKGFGDGGDGGAYKGGDGLFNDHGNGGELDHGGYGGVVYSYWINNDATTRTNTPTKAAIYDDGAYAGGWSCSDGMFGEGGYYTCTPEGSACGGGGWYGGGGAGQSSANGSGGGGSSYLWTSTMAKYYTEDSSMKELANIAFFDAPAKKYPNYVPSSLETSSNYFPYMTEYIADAGANAGDGKAMITAVELDDVCVSK